MSVEERIFVILMGSKYLLRLHRTTLSIVRGEIYLFQRSNENDSKSMMSMLMLMLKMIVILTLDTEAHKVGET